MAWIFRQRVWPVKDKKRTKKYPIFMAPTGAVGHRILTGRRPTDRRGKAMKERTFAVIGGDKRSAYVAQYLIQQRFCVKTVGLEQSGIVDAPYINTLQEALETADYIILPLPLLDSNGKMLAPFAQNKLDVYSMIARTSPQSMLFGGRIPPVVNEHARRCERNIFDYYLREELQVMNAVPTAEGTVECIMRQIPTTIFGSRMLVTGFGRTAQSLCLLLRAMGSEVTVAVRKREAQAHARSMGCRAIALARLRREPLPYDAIINTIPARVVTAEVLDNVAPNSFVIDIASAPGGVDVEYALQKGLAVEHALSLPGKVAPKTAGKIITETVLNIIEERGCID
jgi:dipicolinate synthase subunit A